MDSWLKEIFLSEHPKGPLSSGTPANRSGRLSNFVDQKGRVKGAPTCSNKAAEMLALGLLIAAVFASYGDTPAHAIQRILHVPRGSRIVVERVNVVGRYATVLSRGATLENLPVESPILLKHFAFGWQALDDLNAPCLLEARGIANRERRSLLLGMPKTKSDRPCLVGAVHDAGPTQDVEMVRTQMQGPMVPGVTVAKNFALGGWYGSGGGESLFRKVGAHWRVASSGGGALGTAEMRAFGVPVSDWCLFEIYNAKCPAKH